MESKPKRRWLRFSLRSLIVLVVMLAIPIAWIARERRQSHRELEIAEQLRKLGVKDVEMGGTYDSWELLNDFQPQGWWRDGMRNVFGERIVWVEVSKDDFNDIALLTRLEYLGVLCLPKHSQVVDFTPLAGLTRLRHLELNHSSISDLTPLVGLNSLRILQLESTPVSDLRPLALLKNLESLQLDSTKVSDLTPLAGAKALVELHVSDTEISDVTPLAGLSNLKYLSLAKTMISDVTPLAGLKNLQFLNLYESPVADEQVELLRKALPNCKITAK